MSDTPVSTIARLMNKFWSLNRSIVCRKCYGRIEELENKLARYEPKFRFTHTVRISGDEIQARLKQIFPKADIRMADNFYDVMEWDELLEWLNTDSTADMKYCEDIFDCDDFAFESAARIHLLGKIQNKNYSYRWTWGNTPLGYHAFCIAKVLMDGEKKVFVIEPQNRDTESWKLSDYKPNFGVF